MSRNWKAAGIVFIGFLALAVVSLLMHRDSRHSADLAGVLAQAQKTGKPVLVDFWAEWCGPCQEMRRTTWKDPRVVKATSDYIFLEVNVDQDEKLAEQYEVSGLPHVAVLDSHGRVMKVWEGFLSPEDLLAWLHSPSTTTSSVRLLDPAR